MSAAQCAGWGLAMSTTEEYRGNRSSVKTLLLCGVFLVHFSFYYLSDHTSPKAPVANNEVASSEVKKTPAITWVGISNVHLNSAPTTFSPKAKPLKVASALGSQGAARGSHASSSSPQHALLPRLRLETENRGVLPDISRRSEILPQPERPVLLTSLTPQALSEVIGNEKLANGISLGDKALSGAAMQSGVARAFALASIEKAGSHETTLADRTRVTKVTSILGTYCIEQNAQNHDGQDDDHKRQSRMISCKK